ncbi:MAG: CehA/McbA family metallohydrolase [Anaerolineales bacterium]
MHTTYSDGSGTYAELGRAALRAGPDVLLVTDHNILVQGVDAYYREGKKRVLVLACEEIHDQKRAPQKNHLLVFGASQELATLADDPQNLINAVRRSGGLCFIAHPVDLAMPAFGEPDISWEDWGVTGFTGLELWNGFSELKAIAKGKLDAIFHAFFPETIPHGPLPQTIHIWDNLLSQGQRVVAVGGSDAHAQHMTLGPLHKTIFPYEYHFSTINTHILVPTPLTGDLAQDRIMVFDALAAGHCYIGNDLPASTRGFRFSAQGKTINAMMGDAIQADGPLTLQAKFPSKAEIHLVKDGNRIKTLHGDTLTHIANQAGVYRIEAYKHFLGKFRGWIFSNPIYVK